MRYENKGGGMAGKVKVGMWIASNAVPGGVWEISSAYGRLVVNRRAIVDLQKLLAQLIARAGETGLDKSAEGA